MTLLKKYDDPPKNPLAEMTPDERRLESHINDSHGECQNIAEASKLLALVSTQVATSCIFGYSGFVSAAAVAVPCLIPIHQSLTQIDNSMGIAIDNPKRFVSGLVGAGITTSNAAYSIYKGFQIENLKKGAIAEIKAGEALITGKNQNSDISSVGGIIVLLAAIIAVLKIKQRK